MSRVLRSLVLLCAFALPVLVVAGCPGPEYPKCEKDDHCKKNKEGKAINEYCLFGQCQQCAKDNHCPSGMKCNRGKCEKACTADDQCGGNEICEGASCVPEQCNDARPCSGSLECKQRRCVPKSTTGQNGGGGGDGDLNCNKSARVQFDFNLFDLRPEAREALDTVAKCLQKNPEWKLTVEGHADERGTTDYNLQLGDRRAGSIKEYLVRLGVDKSRIKTISYGEEKPLTAAATEEAWAQNRRGELVVQ
jgi:peptidoglycan-associated lipoprotein